MTKKYIDLVKAIEKYPDFINAVTDAGASAKNNIKRYVKNLQGGEIDVVRVELLKFNNAEAREVLEAQLYLDFLLDKF